METDNYVQELKVENRKKKTIFFFPYLSMQVHTKGTKFPTMSIPKGRNAKVNLKICILFGNTTFI